jgi:undecaprenyl-diphosphatase
VTHPKPWPQRIRASLPQARRWLPKAPRWLLQARRWLPQESRVLFIALGIVLGVWIFFVVASAMTAGRTQALDERVLLALRRGDDRTLPIGPPWLQTMALEITALGSPVVLITIILLVAGHLAIERRFAMMSFMLLSSFGGMLMNSVLKSAFGRPRPTVVLHLAIVGSTSFPSGHSMIAAVVYLTLGALLARTTTRWRLRLYYLGAALFLTLVVGLSRMYLGVHYPSDVLAGWCAGVVWALTCELGAAYLQRRGVVRPPTA